MQVLLFIYDLSFSCSPVFKDPCLRAAHFRRQSCRRYLPALLVFMSLRLACCRCARSLQRGAVFTASLSVRQAFLFQPGDFFLPTSSRFVSGGGFYIHRFFPSSPLLHFFSGPAFLRASDRFSLRAVPRGGRLLHPLFLAVKRVLHLFSGPAFQRTSDCFFTRRVQREGAVYCLWPAASSSSCGFLRRSGKSPADPGFLDRVESMSDRLYICSLPATCASR
jgi:hypothetical protein